MFGLYKKKEKTYPVIISDMVMPDDEPLTTADVKRAYQILMKELDVRNTPKKSTHTQHFANTITDEAEYLKNAIMDAREEITQLEKEFEEISTQLMAASEDDKTDTLADIEALIEAIDDEMGEVVLAKKNLEDFQKDKREFFFEYINTELGHESNL